MTAAVVKTISTMPYAVAVGRNPNDEADIPAAMAGRLNAR